MTLFRCITIIAIFFMALSPWTVLAVEKKKREKPKPSVEVNLDVLDAKGVKDPDKHMPLLKKLPPDYSGAPYSSEIIREVLEPPPLPKQKPFIEVETIPQQTLEASDITETVDAPLPPPEPEPPPLPKRETAVRNTVISVPNVRKKDADVDVPTKVTPVKVEKIQDGSLEAQLVEPTAKDVFEDIGDIEEAIQDVQPAEEYISEIPVAAFRGEPATTLIYERTAVSMDGAMKKQLLQNVLAQVTGPRARIEIESYASPSSEGSATARRLSLARAIEVRDFLIAQDIDSKKIEVQALGDKNTAGSTEKAEKTVADRVDIYVLDTSNH